MGSVHGVAEKGLAQRRRVPGGGAASDPVAQWLGAVWAACADASLGIGGEHLRTP